MLLSGLMRWLDSHVPLVMRLFGTTESQCMGMTQTTLDPVIDLIRKYKYALQELFTDAESTAAGHRALRDIQVRMASALPPAVDAPMRVLVVVAVGRADNLVQMANLSAWLNTFADYDFYVYSYACETEEALAAHRHALKKHRNLAMLHHKVKSGCKLAFWVHAIEAAKRAKTSYTHMWFVDNDLDTRHFHKSAFEALVRHNAPLVCQPGILARKSGARGSDHPLCEVQFKALASRAKNFYSLRYDLRGRRLRSPRSAAQNSLSWQIGGVEVMCPLIDCRLIDAFHRIVATFDDRSDWACERVFNQLATEFAQYSSSQNVPRVDKLVLDFVPLIHMDTRTIGSKSVCKREDLDEVDIKMLCSLLANTQQSCHALKWVDQRYACGASKKKKEGRRR